MPLIRRCLYEERNHHGTVRYRFRKDRDSPRITLPGHPGEPDFEAAYRKLMAGQDFRRHRKEAAQSRFPEGTLGYLADLYFKQLDDDLDVGKIARATHKQRLNLIGRVLPEFGEGRMASLEPRHIRQMMNRFRATPHQANNLLKALRAMFRFGVEIGELDADPSTGVKGNSKATNGFRTWTVDEVRAFFACHPLGTRPHLAMSLLIVTACRRSDLVLLGPRHINRRGDRTYISFRQAKLGFGQATQVDVPLVDALARAIEASPTGQETFLITEYGKPFSKNGFGSRFKSWCREAGLPDDLSAHGIRKAVGSLLAEAGCTQYEIMALHGHSDPKTSEIYTRSVDRLRLAEQALDRIDLGKIMG